MPRTAILPFANSPEPTVRPRLKPDRHALTATGPRTPEGKKTSSGNAITHGLTARQTVISGESQADFDALLERLTCNRKPVGDLEVEVLGEIAASTWRLARARAQEARMLEVKFGLFDDGNQPGFERLMRDMNSIERQLNRAIVRLEHLQAERRKLETAAKAEPRPKVIAAGATVATGTVSPEFVSQNTENMECESAALAVSATLGMPVAPDPGPARRL